MIFLWKTFSHAWQKQTWQNVNFRTERLIIMVIYFKIYFILNISCVIIQSESSSDSVGRLNITTQI